MQSLIVPILAAIFANEIWQIRVAPERGASVMVKISAQIADLEKRIAEAEQWVLQLEQFIADVAQW